MSIDIAPARRRVAVRRVPRGWIDRLVSWRDAVGRARGRGARRAKLPRGSIWIPLSRMP